ncbi:hypothetical protein [Fibrobacter sp. UWR2]|uniref:hypothetical protein n=1 Tax=Fibrobacter sp. UWR2 TaxID=1964352 RepID=UPI000B525FCB|nr:hypothetical protein [Fibrobacter sp. UWR2]MBR4348099.1 hypothetical protein [Fibrobacter sp.]OWV02256.1 hypothetical protein B7994_03355 [Fibrobacter sp. UWR2]
MKRFLTLAGCAALALALGACGDSKSPTDSDDILSSGGSSAKSSSSKEAKSSSSVSEDIPKGARAATLDDLERNMKLKDMFGRDIYLATGEKHGLFSFWIPDTAWIAVPSDFKDGVISFSSGAITSIKIENKAIESMEELVEKDSDHSMRFIVNEDDQLQYSLDGGKYKDVTEATVKKNSSVISNGDSLASKELFCKTGENTFTGYSFYKGRYVATDVVRNAKQTNDSLVSWSAGYYDIHRGKLLMRPLFYSAPVYALVSASVSSDYKTLTISAEDVSCTLSELKYNEVPAADLEGEWESDEGGLTWSLDMRADRTFEVKAFKGNENKALKQGIWDVYGNQLLMKMTGCLGGKCTPAVIGSVSKWKAGSFFDYGNSDPDDPSIPESWNAPEYE